MSSATGKRVKSLETKPGLDGKPVLLLMASGDGYIAKSDGRRFSKEEAERLEAADLAVLITINVVKGAG